MEAKEVQAIVDKMEAKHALEINEKNAIITQLRQQVNDLQVVAPVVQPNPPQIVPALPVQNNLPEVVQPLPAQINPPQAVQPLPAQNNLPEEIKPAWLKEAETMYRIKKS